MLSINKDFENEERFFLLPEPSDFAQKQKDVSEVPVSRFYTPEQTTISEQIEYKRGKIKYLLRFAEKHPEKAAKMAFCVRQIEKSISKLEKQLEVQKNNPQLTLF